VSDLNLMFYQVLSLSFSRK